MKFRAGDVLIQRWSNATSSGSIGRKRTFDPISQVGAPSRGEPLRMVSVWIGAGLAAFILASPVPVSVSTPNGAGPQHVSVAALLDRHEHAIGLFPEAATWSGAITQAGATTQYTCAADAGGRYRTDYTMPYGQRSEGSDGAVDWSQDLNGNVISEQLTRRHSVAARLIGYNATLYNPTITWTLDGSSQLDGRQVYRLRTKFNGFDATFYLDAKTALLDGVDIASRSVRYPAYGRYGSMVLPTTTVESQDQLTVTTTLTNATFSSHVDASFAPPPPRQPDFPPGQSEVGLNFESPRSLIVIGASINGKPVKLLIDSGSSTSLLDLDEAKALQLPTSGSAHVAGATMLTGSVARVDSLDLGGLRFHPFVFEAVPLGLPASIRGYGIVGILGYDVLAHVVARIDYPHARVRLISPSSFSYAGTGAVLPLDAASRVPRVAGTFSQKDPVSLTVDTGSESGLILYTDFAAAHANDFMRPGELSSEASRSLGSDVCIAKQGSAVVGVDCNTDPSKFFGDLRLASGAGGTIHVKTAYLQRLGLGKFSVERVFTEIVLQPTGAFVPTQTDGLLGAGVLQGFGAVFLDYSGGRLILER
jgi:hypothetical protein